MRDLLDPKATPRIPREIRRRAYYALKHYPWDSHLLEVVDMPLVFSWPITRERYRQILTKMHRQWGELRALEEKYEKLHEQRIEFTREQSLLRNKIVLAEKMLKEFEIKKKKDRKK